MKYGTFPPRSVNLSQYHAGQMVTPEVTESGNGGILTVSICWHDACDRTTSAPQTRRFASLGKARAWVSSQGIVADDSRTWI